MTKVEIELVLFLYEAGLSKSVLGRLFEKDHTTIIHHVQKWGAVQVKPICRALKVVIFKPVKQAKPRQIASICHPVAPKALTYADYLERDRQRASKERIERLKLLGRQTLEGCRIADHSSSSSSDDWA